MPSSVASVTFSNQPPQQQQQQSGGGGDSSDSSWTMTGSEESVVLQGYGAYNETQTHLTNKDSDIAATGAGAKSKGRRTKRTWDGVFMPVSVSVFGVVLFIRLPWIVGEAGLLLAMLGIFLCYMASGLTTVSMAAISTNGYVGDGGPYMMISRCLGPQVGIVVGVTFVAANAVSSAMYLIGSAEIMVKIIPWVSLETWEDQDKYLVTLVISTIMLMLLLLISFLSIEKYFRICCLLLTAISIVDIIVAMVSEQPNPNNGFSGPTKVNWNHNVYPDFDSDTNFQTILATLFPGVTGVMSGVCVSGELMHSAKAIPKGIAYAWLVSLVIYSVMTFVISASFDRVYLRNNFAIFNHVGHPWLFYPGEAVACFAAVLAMLGGSVRVLQAIAKDDLMRSRVIRIVGKSSLKNATLFYGLIVQLILFVGDTYQPVSLIAAQIYCANFAALNISTFVSSVSGVVSFRPIYRFFNKSTALFGAFVNIVLMFYMNPVSALCFTLGILALVVVVDFNVDTSSIPWGDASQPIVFHFVRKWLLRLDERKEHIRHWRPSIIMVNTDPLCSLNLMHLANNLKKGGLFELAFILKGDFESTSVSCFRWKGWAMDFIGASGIKAFAVVSFGQTLRTGVQSILRTCGLGGMKANTVIISLDEYLQKETFSEVYRTFAPTSQQPDQGMASYFHFTNGGASIPSFGRRGHGGGTDSAVPSFGKRKVKGIEAVKNGENCEKDHLLNGVNASNNTNDYEEALSPGAGNRYATRASRIEEAIEKTAMAPRLNEQIWAALQRTSVVLPRGAVEGLGSVRSPNMLSDLPTELENTGKGTAHGQNKPHVAFAASPVNPTTSAFSTYRTRAADKMKLSKAIAIFRNNDNKHRDDEEHQIEKMVSHRRAAMERNAVDLATFEDIEEFCNVCADVNHVQMNLVIARNIDKLDKRVIEQAQSKVYIDLWLPDEDDAVVFLMGYSLSRTSIWQKNAVLRIVSVVKYNEEIEPQNDAMRAILKKHRIDALSHTVSLEMETTRRGVDNPDQVHELLQDESTRFELLNSIMKNETAHNTAIILCRVDPYQRPPSKPSNSRSGHHHKANMSSDDNGEGVGGDTELETCQGDESSHFGSADKGLRDTIGPTTTTTHSLKDELSEGGRQNQPIPIPDISLSSSNDANINLAQSIKHALLVSNANNNALNTNNGSFNGNNSFTYTGNGRNSSYHKTSMGRPPLARSSSRMPLNDSLSHPHPHDDEHEAAIARFEMNMSVSGVGGLTRKLSALDSAFESTFRGMRRAASDNKIAGGTPRATGGPPSNSALRSTIAECISNNYLRNTSAEPPISLSAPPSGRLNTTETAREEPTNDKEKPTPNEPPQPQPQPAKDEQETSANSLAKEWFASIVALSSDLPPMLMIAGGPMKGHNADW